MKYFINKALKMIEMNKGINKSGLLSLAIFITIIRISGDLIFIFLMKTDHNSLLFWNIITTVFITGNLFLYIFNDFLINKNYLENVSSNNYFKEFTIVLLLIIGSFILNIIIPDAYVIESSIFQWYSLIFIDVVSAYLIFVGLYLLHFFFKWSAVRRHKKTKFYLKVLIFGIPFVIIFDTIRIYTDSQFFTTIKILSIIFLLVICFLNTKKNSWIAELPRNEKLKLLWMTTLCIVLGILFSIMTLSNEAKLFNALFFYLPGTNTFISLQILFILTYLARIFFTTIGTLPTSSIVERRVYEVKSLTYLNSVVAQTIELNNLIETVTNLALSSSGADAAWTITNSTSKEKKLSILTRDTIKENDIKELIDNENFKEYLNSILTPTLIPSIPDAKEKLENGLKKINFANSIIVIPLFSRGERFGTLSVMHTEEYFFDSDDVNVLSAFSDNVNIAIENARLLEDSIEKEKYKKELLLAREIEQKLLPQELPELTNYSISGFTIPAEEVGGDYYDVVFLKNNKPCILIGDVSGKGMSAAFYMAQLKGVVLAVAKESTGAKDILQRINDTLFKQIERQMYITLSAIVIENDFGELSYARAGHMPAIIKSKNSVSMITPKGIGIGLANKEFFNDILREEKINLSPGDKCLLFTDGINELRNTHNEELGYDALKHYLESSLFDNSNTIITDIKEKLRNYSKNSKQHDDMTIFVIVYNGSSEQTDFGSKIKKTGNIIAN